MTRYRDQAGNVLTIGPLLGEGGEGRVYALAAQPDLVVKLYTSPLSANQQKKVKLMPTLATPKLLQVCTWPTSAVIDPSGLVVGLTMPRVDVKAARPIHDLTGLTYRLQHFPEADWRFLIYTARNLAAAFATIHEHGQIIGDANPNNIYVAQNSTVLIIDTDSFQFTSGKERFLCGVGTTEFTPPELQGASVSGVVRTQNHDNFALATYIFQLIVGMGHYPAASVALPGRPHVEMGEAIRLHHFAWGRQAAAQGLQRPPKTPSLDLVPADLASMFEEAFGPRHQRPSAADWFHALTRLLAGLQPCPVNPLHTYQGQTCPWCALDRQQRVYFRAPKGQSPRVQAASPISPRDVQRVWEQITRISPPAERPLMDLRLSKPARYSVPIRLGLAGAGLVVLTLAFISPFFDVPWAVTAFFFGLAFYLIYQADHKGKPETLSEIAVVDYQINALKAQYLQQGSGTGTYHSVLKNLEDIHAQLMDRPKVLSQLQHEAQQKYTRHLIESELQRHTLAPGMVPGVGEKRVQTLRQMGIRTALDIDNRVTRVPVIGAKMAQDLMEWRHELERRVQPAARSVPPSLLEATRLSVDAKMTHLLDHLRQGPAALNAGASAGEQDYLRFKADLDTLLQKRETLTKQL